jgi:hypothetical protein
MEWRGDFTPPAVGSDGEIFGEDALRKVCGACDIIIATTAARLTLKAINSELTRRGYNARMERAGGYSYFLGGEVTDWIDRTVGVRTVNSVTLNQFDSRSFRGWKRVERGDCADGRRQRGHGSRRAELIQ